MIGKRGVMICVKADGPPHIEGSTKDKCTGCDCEVWNSPASKQQKEQHEAMGAVVNCFCPDCAMNQVQEILTESDGIEYYPPTQEMVEEFAEQRKRDLN